MDVSCDSVASNTGSCQPSANPRARIGALIGSDLQPDGDLTVKLKHELGAFSRFHLTLACSAGPRDSN